MSLTRLDSGEFPPLSAAIINDSSRAKNSRLSCETSNSFEDVRFRAYLNSIKKHKFTITNEVKILDNTDFLTCRIGNQLCDYSEDLEKVLTCKRLANRVDFILAPIVPIRPSQYQDDFEAVPDIILPHEVWQSKVAINLGYPPLDNYHVKSIKNFDRLLRHALYLPSPVIVVTCPNSDLGIISLASMINDRLSESQSKCSILIRVSLHTEDSQEEASESSQTNSGSPKSVTSTSEASKSETTESGTSMSKTSKSDTSMSETSKSDTSKSDTFKSDSSKSDCSKSESVATAPSQFSNERTSTNGSPSNLSVPASNSTCQQAEPQRGNHKSLDDSWTLWNCIRSHLNPDPRIGVCLSISEELSENQQELDKWSGEPVHMLTFHSDIFCRSISPNSTPYLGLQFRTFIEKLAQANSFKLALVLESHSGQDVREYLSYMKFLIRRAREDFDDFLIAWDDRMQSPLQPLSSNLDSSTYGVFEMDSTKYITYKEAMLEALFYTIDKFGQERKQFNLMVLGAGRGPLVDSMIEAINELMQMCPEMTNYRFKIYALDKNPSSVRALIFKQKMSWVHPLGYYETEVVESDMRVWEPGVKADIIATELLGSLSDNELSPECIDGVWKFSTPQTIPIPREYSSYIAPICSYKLFQELYRKKTLEPRPYDQIYVVKLTNFYLISEPQTLFKFEHEDLSLPPSARCNERFARLIFESKVETVCHGFAGYFDAKLFGDTTLSTVINRETKSMYSWFPAFIPLEKPIQLKKGSKLVALFWRKENQTNVWYQWATAGPDRSRIYSQNLSGSAMSKFI